MSGARLGTYEIRVGGRLAPGWSDWFDGLAVSYEGDDVTVLRGPIPDQAALYAVLRRVRDVGAPLLSVEPVPLPGGAEPRPLRS